MPSAYPQIDAASWLGHLPEMQKDTFGFYLKYHQQFGEHLRFNAIPGVPFYSFASPDALHHVLIKSREKYSRGARWRKIVGYLGGNGLVTSIGEHWQKQRQLMNPFFHVKQLENYVPGIVKNSLKLIEHWQGIPEKTEINISEAMTFLGLINISDVLFGYDIRDDAKSFSTAMANGFAYLDHHIKSPLAVPKFLPTGFNRTFKKQLLAADLIAGHIIKSVRSNGQKHMVNELVAAGNSNKALRDEIITLLMAGHDTTATALAWAWYLLARHPDILRNVQEELHAILKGVPPTVENYTQLTFTRMVFEETLRLYPSVWALHRFSEESDEVNGYAVRKGCSVALPIYVTHRNPEYWQFPHKFYPEHFSKTGATQRPRFSYLPFGAGERVCIGAQLAIMEGVLILATLLQVYVPMLASNEPINPCISFTLRPEREIIAVKKTLT